MDSGLTVRKREGGQEPWNFDKLVTSINKAGVPISDAESIASSVETWAKENSENSVVDSTVIRDKVTELLKQNYPAESDSYMTYKKS